METGGCEYRKLEADALRQYLSLPQEYHDAYKQLILFPVQAMANLYEMYYAQAMNHKLYKENNPASQLLGWIRWCRHLSLTLCYVMTTIM